MSSSYIIIECPLCYDLVFVERSEIQKIGVPFKLCESCKKMYKSKYTKEWITINPVSRFFYYLDPGSISIGIFIAFILYMTIFINIALWGLIISIFLCICLYIIMFFLNKYLAAKIIEESLDRTKSANYVKELLNAGYKIYPIKNTEVGTLIDNRNYLPTFKGEPDWPQFNISYTEAELESMKERHQI